MPGRPGPGALRCRRIAAVLAATSLLALGTGLAAAADPLAPNAGPATSSAAPAGTLLLDRMTTVLREGQDLAIRGRLRLTGVPAGTLEHSSVALFVGGALGSRAALHVARDATDGRVAGSQVSDAVPVTANGEFA